MKEKILEDFNKQKNLLDSFKERITNLLKDLLDDSEISIHQLSHRTKNFESLNRKIDKKEGKYKSLNDITDLVGIRIITYLESDVDNVASLIEKEFKLDTENSTDKRKLKIDQFGYKSLHIVATLNLSRSKLREYKKYANLKCEIQIRSILQHAWAEIEHDLGYKSPLAIPETSKRSFNRLAALLETADIEFDRLKKELSNYEMKVPDLIVSTPDEVKLDQASLNSFILTNKTLQQAIKIMEEVSGALIYDANISTTILKRFEFFKINSIKEFADLLNENSIEYLAFVREFVKDFDYEELPSYLSVFYFHHFLAAKTQDPDVVEKYFEFASPQIDSDGSGGEEFVEIYKKIKNPK